MAEIPSGKKMTPKSHTIKAITFTAEDLVIAVDGATHVIKLRKASQRLAAASEVERNVYQISPSGYGIHWPLIDEDLSVDGLLRIGRKAVSRGAKKAARNRKVT